MKHIITLFLVSLTLQVAGQSKICNRTVAFKDEAKLLPKNFCMPEGFWVVDVQIEDLNCDGSKDRIIEYCKKDLVCGDTTFYDLFYFQTDSSFKFAKTLSNLHTPKVKSFNYDWLKANCDNADDLYWYIYSNDDLIKFEEGLIIVGFAINEEAGYNFFFKYDKLKNNWYLTNKQNWDFPNAPNPLRPILPSSHAIKDISNGISIDEFSIKDFLEPL